MTRIMSINEVMDKFRQSSNFIGFNDLFDNLAHSLESAGDKYPPFNVIQVDDDNFTLEFALSGYAEKDIEILTENDELVVRTAEDAEFPEEEGKFLHRGISRRKFERKFRLADHIKVKSASMEQGLLTIGLEREIPEAMKPKRIAINSK